jgi:hypothetical protein
VPKMINQFEKNHSVLFYVNTNKKTKEKTNRFEMDKI